MAQFFIEDIMEQSEVGLSPLVLLTLEFVEQVLPAMNEAVKWRSKDETVQACADSRVCMEDLAK